MLQKLGEQLQQARQARGVSLEDAERIIRIRRKYLAAARRTNRWQVRGFEAGRTGSPLVARVSGRHMP